MPFFFLLIVELNYQVTGQQALKERHGPFVYMHSPHFKISKYPPPQGKIVIGFLI